MAKRNEEDSPLSFKRKSFLRHSRVKVHKRNCVAAITSAKINSQSGATRLKRCGQIIRFERFLRHLVSTEAFSIITPKVTLLKRFSKSK